MSITLQQIELGPLGNNTFAILESESKTAIIVDPTQGADVLLAAIRDVGFKLVQILLTHAHFDHISGAADLANSTIPAIPVHLHPDDFSLWQVGGNGAEFGFRVELCDSIQTDLYDGQVIRMGAEEIRVSHTPGHTRGHVIFYIPYIKTALVGDLIFRDGVGRTDLTGGSAAQLKESVRTRVFTLPDDTKLIPGHGPATSVGYEKTHNPFF